MSATPAWVEVLVERFGSRVLVDEPVAPRCTYRVGGAAAALIEVDGEDDVRALMAAVASHDPAILVVGRGSNLLVSDAGFPGLIVVLGDGFETVEVDRVTAVARLGGAALLPVAARRIAAAGLTGFEWAVGVPGSAGGAVRMNAGGHGSDMAASVARARVADLRTGDIDWWQPSRLAFGYRHSAIEPHQVVLSVEVQLAPGDAGRATAELSEIVRWRREHQPGGQNAGSVFANPEGDSAGRLIDVTGLKGLRIGTAEVSTKHANFIQADPGGSADDVRALIVEVRRRIWDAHGVALRCENHLIGFGPLPVLEGTDSRSMAPGVCS